VAAQLAASQEGLSSMSDDDDDDDDHDDATEPITVAARSKT
jgi:hypothetical protein